MKEKALEKYATAVAAVKEHSEANSAVFQAHQELLFKVMDAENELRDAVAEDGTGISNGLYNVTVTPQEQVVVDTEKLKTILTSEKYAEIVTVNQRPARVMISPIKQPTIKAEDAE